MVEKVKEQSEGHGFNAQTFEYVDLTQTGIIDPAKVERCALQNAASIAAMFLTTEALVVETAEKKKSPPIGAGADMDY